MEGRIMRELKGFTLTRPIFCCGLAVEPGENGQAVARPAAEMDRKRFERQYGILLGYACLALGRLPRDGERADLGGLELPEREGSEAAAAVWYARACQSESEAAAVIAVYNGLGALPGGYPQVQARAERYMGREGAGRFLEYVRAAKEEENDLGERSSEPRGRAFWAGADVRGARGALREACLDCRRES